MIHIPLLRTRRFTAQLRELTIGESIALAAMPTHQYQASTTSFLRYALAHVQGLEDPRFWTVQERTLAVCHYLAAVVDDGPDFSVGEGRYSDYLDGARDIPHPVEPVILGELGGDTWTLRHLTGWAAEAIERLDGEIPGLTGEMHWLLGGMAAQLARAGEEWPEDFSDEVLVARMQVLKAFPESDFVALAALYQAGRDKLHHLFRYEFGEEGILILPREEEGESALPPARFPVRAGLSPFTHRMVGQSLQSGE